MDCGAFAVCRILQLEMENEEMSNAKYSIKVNRIKKVVEMMVGESFTDEDVKNFVNDYLKNMSSIDTSAYTLEVDCTTMKVVEAKMAPKLEASFNMYKESGFNKVIFQISKNTVLKMQLNRIARGAGLTNSEVVEVA